MLDNYQKECIRRGVEKKYNSTIIGDILGVNSGTVRMFLKNDKMNAGLPPKTKVSKKITIGRVGLQIKNILIEHSKLSLRNVKKRLKEQILTSLRQPSETI
jgi:hypothetical protein